MAAIKIKQLDENELLEFISKELPRLIVDRPEIRYEIIGIVSDQFVEKKDFAQILYEIKTLREDFQHEGVAWRSEMKALREEFQTEMASMREDFQTEMASMREDSQTKMASMREDFQTKMASMREDFQNSRKEFKEEMASMREDLQTLREDFQNSQKEFKEEMVSMRKDFQNLREDVKRIIDTKFSAVGARWGINSEESFRNGLRGILTDLPGLKVEQFIGFDKEGSVFGEPDQIELDVIVKDGILILVEIKSSMSKGDVSTFQRKVEWYEKEYNVKVDRKVIISPMIDPHAVDKIDRLGIEMYSYGDEAKI